MMYYAYLRKLDGTKYIGFAVVVNGYYFKEIVPLFEIFAKRIEKLAEKGVIINFSENGHLTTSLTSLSNEEEEAIENLQTLQSEINKIPLAKKLPPVNFGVAVTSKKIFADTDDNAEMVKASYTYGITLILKQTNYDSIRTNSYKNTLKRINEQNVNLKEEVEKLKEQNRIISRQKKQFKKVLFLFLVVIACGVGLYQLYDNLDITKGELSDAKTTIHEQDSVIRKNYVRISDLERSLTNEKSEKSIILNQLHDITKHYPFIVTSCSVTSNSFKFDYYCPVQKEITVTLKAINYSHSEIISSTHTLTFYKGGGTKTLDFQKQLNFSRTYYAILMYNSEIMAGKYW